jgi:hypothetical protein
MTPTAARGYIKSGAKPTTQPPWHHLRIFRYILIAIAIAAGRDHAAAQLTTCSECLSADDDQSSRHPCKI